MKLHHLRDVIAVAETGSLRSAARHLGLAQPALTRSIQELERELGVMLFERRVYGTALTPMGETFLRRAKGIQLEIQRTQDEIEQLKGQGVGSVSVGLSTAGHVALLPRVIEPFRRRYPDVRLNIREGLFPAMEADIQDGALDFFIGPMAENFKPTELIVELLFANRRIIVGRKGHPLGLSPSLAELTGAAWVTTSFSRESELELNSVFERCGQPKPKIVAQADTALSIIAIAASSDLLAMLPQQWLEFIATTQLVQHIAVQDELRGPGICSIRRARLPLTPAAEYLSDLFRRAAMNHARRLPGQPKS